MFSSFNGANQAGRKSVARFRYYRFYATKVRTPGVDAGYPNGIIQMSEFIMLLGNTRIDYTGATATNPGGSNPVGEEPPKGIDNDQATKWLDFNFDSNLYSILQVDFGSVRQTDAFQYRTANDVDGRDPIRWLVQGSNDTTTWYTVHDQNSSDATITTSRYTLTQVFYFNKNY
jgi:hypothetical protein